MLLHSRSTKTTTIVRWSSSILWWIMMMIAICSIVLSSRGSTTSGGMVVGAADAVTSSEDQKPQPPQQPQSGKEELADEEPTTEIEIDIPNESSSNHHLEGDADDDETKDTNRPYVTHPPPSTSHPPPTPKSIPIPQTTSPHSTFLPSKHRPPHQQKPKKPKQILTQTGRTGITSGLPGLLPTILQILTITPLRTLTSYQHRYGTSLPSAIATLYYTDEGGGVRRFYRGVGFAIFEVWGARLMTAAATDGVETTLWGVGRVGGWLGLGGSGGNGLGLEREEGFIRSVGVVSLVVGMGRVVLMPIDTCKVVLQVDDVEGFRDLVRKLKAGKVGVLYEGALANIVAAIISHYPWFYTYNYLSRSQTLQRIIYGNLLRNAAIGFLSSVVSDSVSNVVRVIKTTKQAFASKHSVSYGEVVSMILAADGWKGLFGRGLRTRILGNAFQSLLFTVLWRGMVEKRNDRRRPEEENRHNSKEGEMDRDASSSSSRDNDGDLDDDDDDDNGGEIESNRIIIDDLYQ